MIQNAVRMVLDMRTSDLGREDGSRVAAESDRGPSAAPPSSRSTGHDASDSVLDVGKTSCVAEVLGVLLVVALEADSFRNSAPDVRPSRREDVLLAWTVANFALNVSKRLLGLARSIAELRAETDDVTGNALGLVMPMYVEEGLERRGVAGRLPLRELGRMAARAGLRADIGLVLPVRVP